jgi:hypothetical protein
MSNWQKTTIESDDGGGTYEIERLSIGRWLDLDINHTADGFYADVCVDGLQVEFIGYTDTLDAAKKLAERWALAQIAEMLKSLGAAGIWMLRDTDEANLFYHPRNAEPGYLTLSPQPPHPRLMLIRFPTGDGGEEGIEYL